jgi:hypothetical protein
LRLGVGDSRGGKTKFCLEQAVVDIVGATA